MTPDGLITSLRGPFLGSRNDLTVWRESGLAADLTPMVVSSLPDGTESVVHLFGDKAYRTEKLIMYPFHPAVGAEEKEYNTTLSRLRISVEHGFSRVTALWGFTEVKKVMRTGLQPTGAYYYAMALFTNIRTCMSGGNQISDQFNLRPPTLSEYLA